MPTRARGLVLGFIMLAAGPLTALMLTSPTAVATTATHTRAPIVEDVALAQIVPAARMLRYRAPIVHAPAAHPRPVHWALRQTTTWSPPKYTGTQAQIVAIIMAAAARHGVSGSWMVRIASCESGLRPNAYNPRGPYIGLFQFLSSTFVANGGTNIWSAYDQADIAAKMLAHGQAWQWSCA